MAHRKHKWKRLVLSLLLPILNDETSVTIAYNLDRFASKNVDQRLSLKHTRSRHQRYQLSPFSGSLRNKHKLIFMVDLSGDNRFNEDRRWYPDKPDQDDTFSRSSMAAWSTEKLLTTLDDHGIRYAPTSSRSELEDAFVQSMMIKNDGDSSILDPNSNRHENVTQDVNHFNQSLVNNSYPYDDNNLATSRPRKYMEERLQKREQRRRQYPTRRHRIGKTMSKVLFSVVPSAAGNMLDYTKRKTRRLQRRITDFMLLDEETGVRDVVRYDYIRREQRSNFLHYSRVSEVVLGPGDAIEVIVTDRSPQTSPSEDNVRSSRALLDASLSDDQYSTVDQRPSIKSLPSRAHESSIAYHSNMAHLPSPTNGYQDTKDSFSSSDFHQSSRGRRRVQNTKDRKVYNPYGAIGQEINNDDKDVIDRVSEFLTSTADQIFDRILNNDVIPTTNDQQSDAKAATSRATTAHSQQQQQHRRTDNKRSNQRKHWKDRLEERLDSMLGLHESGDFYRSWTERYEQKHDMEDGEGGETYDAFSVAQGRKRPKQSGKPVYDKPFWEEDGNIFSLLFGRKQHFTKPPRIDRRLSGMEAGSILSIFRFVFQNFMIVASFLCRWASTQGALPQPVVVFGVGSAMVCARPHRRLFAAGVTLLLLRTVGEVLHGYVYGGKGWEDDNANDSFVEQYDDNDFNGVDESN